MPDKSISPYSEISDADLSEIKDALLYRRDANVQVGYGPGRYAEIKQTVAAALGRVTEEIDWRKQHRVMIEVDVYRVAQALSDDGPFQPKELAQLVQRSQNRVDEVLSLMARKKLLGEIRDTGGEISLTRLGQKYARGQVTLDGEPVQ